MNIHARGVAERSANRPCLRRKLKNKVEMLKILIELAETQKHTTEIQLISFICLCCLYCVYDAALNF